MGDIANRIAAAREEAQNLEQELRGAIDSCKDADLKTVCKDVTPVSGPRISCKRTLRGHMGKVYSMHWAENCDNLVSAAQDGVLIVWDGISTNKINAIPLACAWVMTCCMAPECDFVASGGLDNSCSVFNLKDPEKTDNGTPCQELIGHNGHLSACRFVGSDKIITSSGDKTCMLWDIETGKSIHKFTDHTGDVLCVSLSHDKNYFVSGSVDQSSRLFDLRTNELAQMRFVDHTSDVNAVQFFPNGNAFGTGSEDNTAKLYDIRFGGSLNTYEGDCGVTSVAFSASGKYFFTSYSNMGTPIKVWDTLLGSMCSELKGHKERVSSIGISGDGRALGSACWDKTLKIWA